MICYFLRHAEKDHGDFYNPRLRHQDAPLSEKGQMDALIFNERCGVENIARIFVSGYQRTRQTIEPFAGRLQLIPVVDERLNEIDNGLVGDMSEAEFRRVYPQEWQAFNSRSVDFRFPGGETGVEAQHRIIDFMADIQPRYSGETILVVSHDGLIRLWICHMLGLPVYRRADFQTDPCGLTEVHYLEDTHRWKLVRFNQAIG